MKRMIKEFDQWNKKKKLLNQRENHREIFFHEREVWWCSIGVNLGVEADGKHEHFERPVLILRKFNGEMFWGLPLTSKEKVGPHYLRIQHDRGVSWVCLSQIRTISTKRILRKIGMVPIEDFTNVCERVGEYITIGPRISAGSSEAEATNN